MSAVFEAYRYSSPGLTGLAYVYMTGTVQVVNGQLLLTAVEATGSSNGDLVNNQQFFSSAQKLMRITAILRQLQ